MQQIERRSPQRKCSIRNLLSGLIAPQTFFEPIDAQFGRLYGVWLCMPFGVVGVGVDPPKDPHRICLRIRTHTKSVILFYH
jgi:hypothetical protein